MNYFHFPNIQDPCPFNTLPNYKDEYLKLSQTQSHVKQNFINFKSTQRVAHEPSDNLLPKQFSQYKNYFSLNNQNYNDKQLAVSQITSQSLNRSVKNNSKRPVSVDNQLVAQRPIKANLESMKNFNSDEAYKNLQENSFRQMLQSSNQNRNSNLNSYKPEQFSSPQRFNSKKIRENYAQNSPNNQLKQSGDSQNNSKVFISTATTFSKSYTNGFNQTNFNFNNQINSSQNNSYHNLNFNRNVKKNQSYSQNFNQIQTPKNEQTYNPQIASTSVKNQQDNFQPKDKKNMVFRPKRYFQSTNTSPYGQLQKPRYVYTKPSTSYTAKSASRSQSRKKNTIQSRNLKSPTNENIQTNGSQ
ncbi:hypothetical protein PPERSA_10735 [Pseudocohnilembus persalinus]|uniref:Uncharacterized protein n=1 Tax=Pseudocohnilembus persalinus TaxID=266149 RepID=A0A0V0QDF3_PSEPJ|nr:hypothetical protein PPERSA_10735 [Pseudocohnilembus persalinus]|eukprot:KRX00236.1 hypothetical protein PPERSA_10735 [Pseudocohnilembus persalinus]